MVREFAAEVMILQCECLQVQDFSGFPRFVWQPNQLPSPERITAISSVVTYQSWHVMHVVVMTDYGEDLVLHCLWARCLTQNLSVQILSHA